jgi:WD40 repeat protein
MFRVILTALVLGVLMFAGVAYWLQLPIPGFNDEGGGDPVAHTDSAQPARKLDLGDDLYPAAPFPAFPVSAAAKRPAEPVVLRGYLITKDKQDVPALVAGQLLFVGEPVPDGAIEAAGVAGFMGDPFNYASMTGKHGRTYRFFRRLYDGQIVSGDQILGMVDATMAQAVLQHNATKVEIAKSKAASAKAAMEEANNRYMRERNIAERGGSSPADLGAAKAAAEKFKADYETELGNIEAAKDELYQARINYDKHVLRNRIRNDRSVIKQIQKNLGDPVKDQETVLSLNSLDHLLAEALVEDQYVGRLREEMTVTIEPTQEWGQAATLRGAHRGEVTAIAVTNDAEKPRVVSGSVDRTINVWDPWTQVPSVRLWHADAVRSLACSPVGAAANVAVVGCADGSIVIWNMDREALAATDVKPVVTIKAAHSDAVTALAFSPDGTYFASGAADGSIALRRSDNGELVYRFDAEHGVDQPHQGTVTSLSFLPQDRLVSAARDNTLRVWRLKEKGAELQGEPVANRTGTVSQLGVSKDGKWMLFDQGRTLQLVSVERGSTVTTLQSPGSTTPFETLALFSPDGSLVLTAGAPEGRMQLWRSPTETERGFEVRQFVPEEKLPPTCAAFAPRFGTGPAHAFAVSGGANGKIYFWSLPTTQEVENHRIENVPIRVLGRSLDASRQMRIAVDVPNPATPQYPNGRLMPGRPVTIVIGDNQ